MFFSHSLLGGCETFLHKLRDHKCHFLSLPVVSRLGHFLCLNFTRKFLTVVGVVCIHGPRRLKLLSPGSDLILGAGCCWVYFSTFTSARGSSGSFTFAPRVRVGVHWGPKHVLERHHHPLPPPTGPRALRAGGGAGSGAGRGESQGGGTGAAAAAAPASRAAPRRRFSFSRGVFGGGEETPGPHRTNAGGACSSLSNERSQWEVAGPAARRRGGGVGTWRTCRGGDAAARGGAGPGGAGAGGSRRQRRGRRVPRASAGPRGGAVQTGTPSGVSPRLSGT